jgi:hypothetical protein
VVAVVVVVAVLAVAAVVVVARVTEGLDPFVDELHAATTTRQLRTTATRRIPGA